MPTPDPRDGIPGGESLETQFAREAELLRSLAEDPLPTTPPPADLWARVSAAIESDDAPVTAPITPTSVPAPVEAIRVDPEPSIERPSRHPRRSRTRRTILISAVAAVLVLVVGVGIGLVVNSRTTDPTTIATAELTPYDGAAVGDAGATVAVLGEGDQQKLRVDMHDLPAPAPGTFYELWLIDPITGSPISIATMTDGSSDVSTVVDLPAGTDTGRYDVVDVSVQDHAAGPAHSGNSVLRGILAT